MGAGYAFLPIKQVDLLPSELESGVRVTCDVGYLFANFSLPRLLCSRLGTRQTDVRQTDVRRASSLNASDLWGGGITTISRRPSIATTTLRIAPFYI